MIFGLHLLVETDTGLSELDPHKIFTFSRGVTPTRNGMRRAASAVLTGLVPTPIMGAMYT